MVKESKDNTEIWWYLLFVSRDQMCELQRANQLTEVEW